MRIYTYVPVHIRSGVPMPLSRMPACHRDTGLISFQTRNDTGRMTPAKTLNGTEQTSCAKMKYGIRRNGRESTKRGMARDKSDYAMTDHGIARICFIPSNTKGPATGNVLATLKHQYTEIHASGVASQIEIRQKHAPMTYVLLQLCTCV